MTAQSKPEDALEEFKRCAALKPDWFELQVELGIASQRAGDIDAAIAAFEHAAKLNPQDAEVYNDLGLALVQKGDAAGSLPQFQKALQLRPEDGSLRGNLAIAYIQLANFDAAVSELQGALKLAPENASLHYNLGLAWKLKDQLDKAVPEFEEAIRLQPNLADAHYTLGILYWQRGEFDKATVEMQGALRSKPDYAEAHYTLGTVYKQQGKLSESAAELREAIRLQPDLRGRTRLWPEYCGNWGTRRARQTRPRQGRRLWLRPIICRRQKLRRIRGRDCCWLEICRERSRSFGLRSIQSRIMRRRIISWGWRYSRAGTEMSRRKSFRGRRSWIRIWRLRASEVRGTPSASRSSVAARAQCDQICGDWDAMGDFYVQDSFEGF